MQPIVSHKVAAVQHKLTILIFNHVKLTIKMPHAQLEFASCIQANQYVLLMLLVVLLKLQKHILQIIHVMIVMMDQLVLNV